MKKSIFTMVISLFLIFLVSEVNAQQNIVITLKMPPPGTLNVSDFWNITVINNSGSDLSGYLAGTAKEDKDGMIAKGTTVPISIKKGLNKIKIKDLPKTPDVEYIASDPRYKESLIRQGKFPSGKYEICVKLISVSTNEELGSDCITQEVSESGFLSLISPDKEQEIDPKTPIIFTWTSGGKTLSDGYTLKIVEVTENQTPESAMKSNRAFFEMKGIKSTTFTYPNSAKGFKDGKKYGWGVGLNGVWSEIWWFRPKPEHKIGCKNYCSNFFSSFNYSQPTYSYKLVRVNVSFNTSKFFSKLSATVISASTPSYPLSVQILEADVPNAAISYFYDAEVCAYFSQTKINTCELKIKMEPDPNISASDNINFSIKYTLSDSSCYSCDTIINYSYHRIRTSLDDPDLHQWGLGKKDDNKDLMPQAGSRPSNILNNNPGLWELETHAVDMTISACTINSTVVWNNAPFVWKNWEAINRVAMSNVMVDIRDLSPMIENSWQSNHLSAYDDYMPCVIDQLQSCFFNKYPSESGLPNHSNTHGLHFDNLSTYNDVVTRWDNLRTWVEKEGHKLDSICQITGQCDVDKWICLMGIVFHAVQDFYCHSNWVLLASVYGADFSLIHSNLPLWEDYHWNGAWWQNNHSGFHASDFDSKIASSNNNTKKFEFKPHHFPKKKIKPNGVKRRHIPLGGLQTGHYSGPFAMNLGFYPWGHRHPNRWLSWAAFTPWRHHFVEALYEYGNAPDDERIACEELATSSTKWWMRFMLSPERLGCCYERVMEYLNTTKVYRPLPDYKSDIELWPEEDSYSGDETSLCKCNQNSITIGRIQNENSSGNNQVFMLNWNLQLTPNTEKIVVDFLTSEIDDGNLESGCWSTFSPAHTNIPNFIFSIPQNGPKEIRWTRSNASTTSSTIPIVIPINLPSVNSSTSGGDEISFVLRFNFKKDCTVCEINYGITLKRNQNGFVTGIETETW